MRHMFSLAVLSLFLMGQAPSADAQVLALPEQTKTDWVKELSELAGGAAYCGFDQEKQDFFMNLAHAKLASLAGDKVSKVVNKIEFNNALSKTSAKEPIGGCKSFEVIFENAAARLN
ncbi:MAG: hypothetical protein KAI28_00570 [Sphingomonadales bacterium]|nr:hypothetical protein [Sphingomonadales bacterium]